MDYINDLYEMCETIERAISEANAKIRAGGGKMNAGDVDYVDKLTHTLKSIKTSIAMMEDEGEYSGNQSSYNNGGGGSYARRNRASYARGGRSRDSMGRYSGERRYSGESGYSRNDMADKMRELMERAPDDYTRQEIQRMLERME